LTRLVVDANVLVSATVAAPDTPLALLVDAGRTGLVEIVICERLIDEVERGLEHSYFRARLPQEERNAYLEGLCHLGLWLADPVSPPCVVRDPGDDYIVALARAASAAAIVTGDRDLLDHPGLTPPAITARKAYTQLNREMTSRQRERSGDRGERQRPLYRRLSSGSRGMHPEKVARHQRVRLYGAMIEAVSQRGYSATRVADLTDLAGVSRRAFYEQFANKEECFLATYDIVVARTRRLVLDSWEAESSVARRPHSACKVLLDDISDSPKGARLVLVDSLGIGSKARERMHLAGAAFERVVSYGFRSVPDGINEHPLIPRAIVGGMRHIIFTRTLKRRERVLPALTDDSLKWIGSYCTPASDRLGAIDIPNPRSVRSAPTAFLGGTNERTRMLESIIELTLNKGYAQLTDSQIAGSAGISTAVFHQQFANKEECFLAVLDAFNQEALDSVRPKFESASSWPEGVHRAIDTLVDYFVAHEDLLQIAFLNLFEVGPGIAGRMTRSVGDFTEMLDKHGPVPCYGPAVALDGVTGAFWSIISRYVANDRLSHLPCLVDHLTFIVLAPYVGPDQAIQTVMEVA
jgi:putative PIN family toxin of toxin-antitoxin system